VWITQSSPGPILEVRPKSIASLVARGSLTSRSTQRRIVDRDDVLALKVVRCGAAVRQQREREARASRQRDTPDSSPTRRTTGYLSVRRPWFMNVLPMR
jgi:hypothetical protein